MAKAYGLRGWGCAGLLVLLPLIAGCSAGRHSEGFVAPQLTRAYIPLAQRESLFMNHWAAAFVIAPNVGVTNDHNLRFIPADMLLARSRDYDLLFFRTDKTPAMIAMPREGEEVIAYGQGATDDLREARGTVAGLDEIVQPRCADCRSQKVMVFDAGAGAGFSGGPVVDAQSGAVVGVTFGYLDGKAAGGGRRMYAYGMNLVLGEMQRLLGQAAH